MDGKKLVKRVNNIVDMTVEERSALLRVARASKKTFKTLADDGTVFPDEWLELYEALKEVEDLR